MSLITKASTPKSKMSGFSIGTPTKGQKELASREKELETQCADLQMKLAENERMQQDDREKMSWIINELDQRSSALAEAEAKASHADKQKREMNDELERLKNELLDSLDSAAAQQELRTLASLKKILEDEMANHEAVITEMRHKHSHDAQGLNEQLDKLRKNKTVLEKQRNSLEVENSDLQAELKLTSGNKQEADRKRKQLETQCAELQMKLAETERMWQDDWEEMNKIINERDQMSSALAEAEARASPTDKSSGTLEEELNEASTRPLYYSDFEFRPAVASESRSHNRLSIGDEIQQMNLPISQMPLHDLEFRTPEVDTRDASTQTDDTSSGGYVVFGLVCAALAAIFIWTFMVEVEYHYYI